MDNKQERFKRVAEKRVGAAIKKLQSMRELSDKTLYASEKEELMEIIQVLKREIEYLERAFGLVDDEVALDNLMVKSQVNQNEPLLEDIILALDVLGGEARLNEIYDFVKDISTSIDGYEDYTSVIRKTIYLHASECDIFKGQPGDYTDIFYSVKGKGKGVWGLRKN